jgi:hypothetical protein
VGCLRALAWIGGLLVRADNEIAGFEQLPLPAALVPLEDPAGLLAELWVAGEDPGAVVPRADRVGAKPPSHGEKGVPLSWWVFTQRKDHSLDVHSGTAAATGRRQPKRDSLMVIARYC